MRRRLPSNESLDAECRGCAKDGAGVFGVPHAVKGQQKTGSEQFPERAKRSRTGHSTQGQDTLIQVVSSQLLQGG